MSDHAAGALSKRRACDKGERDGNGCGEDEPEEGPFHGITYGLTYIFHNIHYAIAEMKKREQANG
jgi:hypothetical protein